MSADLNYVPDKSVRRVLIHRQGSLGDTLVALPSLHVVARAFPEAERRLLTNIPSSSVAAPALGLVEPIGLAHGAVSYPTQTRNPLEVARMLARVRAWRPEVAVYLVETRTPMQHRRDAALMRLCGVRRLVGYDPSGALSVSHVGADGMHEGEAARLLRAVRPLGTAMLDDAASWDLALTQAEHARAEAVLAPVAGLGPIVAFSIGTKSQVNDYEDANWRAVISKLADASPDAVLVAFGAPGERARSDALLLDWKGPTLNACGALGVRESGAALARADVFIGHDSGPMHLAATVGTRCVAIFSSRNPPGLWYPRGSGHRILRHATSCAPCGLYTCVAEGKRCILSISPSTVVAACVEVLRNADGRPVERLAPPSKGHPVDAL